MLAVLLVLCLVGAPVVQAAVVVDAVAHGSDAATGTTIPNFTLTIGGGVTNGAVICGLTFEVNTVTAVAVTIGGTPAALVTGTDTTTARTYRAMMFGRATGSTTGAQTVSVSWTGTTGAAAGCMSVSGANQATPFNNGTFTTTQQGAGPGTSSVTITSTNGDLTFDWVSNELGSPATAPTQTSQFSFQGADFLTGNSGSTGPGTGTATHTWTAGAFGTTENAGVNIVQAAGAAVSPPRLLLGVGK